MATYQIELTTTEGDFTLTLDTPPMTLGNVTTSPGMLVGLAVKTLNNQGNNISDDDVVSVSITELEVE
jgi:hypothetical protein